MNTGIMHYTQQGRNAAFQMCSSEKSRQVEYTQWHVKMPNHSCASLFATLCPKKLIQSETGTLGIRFYCLTYIFTTCRRRENWKVKSRILENNVFFFWKKFDRFCNIAGFVNALSLKKNRIFRDCVRFIVERLKSLIKKNLGSCGIGLRSKT